MRVFKEAGRPLPPLSDDPVIDYMVVEALVIKADRERRDAEKDAQRKQWKKEKNPELEKLR